MSGDDDLAGSFVATFVECRGCGAAVLTMVKFKPDGTPYAEPANCDDHGG